MRDGLSFAMEPAQEPKRIEVICVEQDDQFADLSAEWNHLAARTVPDSVFLYYEWFDAAWQWAGRQSRRWILVARRAGSIVGIMPLMHLRRRDAGLLVRTLEFLAVPDTQHCDILVAPDDRPDVIEGLAAFLYARRRDWDILDLSQLTSDSETVPRLQAALKRFGLQTWVQINASDHCIVLEGSWRDYYARRSRRLKKGNNLIANRLGKAYRNIELRRVQMADAAWEVAQEAVETAIGISARSWKKEKTGVSLDRLGPAAFIRRLSRHAYRRQWLSLWTLLLDGVPVAMEYQLIHNGHVHALRADFDHAYEELSPGSYMNWKVLEQLFDCDLTAYHMGPGDNPYKLRWVEESRPLFRFIGYSDTLCGRVLALRDRRLRPLAKVVLQKLWPWRS